ncbi:MAG: VIT domain-containing protein [Micromonosporaceae bacterium]
MTIRVQTMTTEEVTRVAPPDDQGGFGALATERGNLPLDEIDLAARITGLTAETRLTQGFHNPYDVPLEATYVFPLPDRAAVTGMRMEAAERVVEGVLKERQEAREAYDAAIQAGQRASIAEEERPDVFTMRVGNILPGERVTVRLTLAGVAPYEDGAATYRFPLVVAPRYIPGNPIEDPVGTGVAQDTDAVPDASRITPPVLLPGFPHPVKLTIGVQWDPVGLPPRELRSSLHSIEVTESGGGTRVTVSPGERLDRDFVLRWGLARSDDAGVTHSLVLVPDPDEATSGTFHLTLVPPGLPETARPRDVVLVLDRSGSMSGWKMVTARRAAARIVDTLTSRDRFAVVAFDNRTERPPTLGDGLVAATDRHRFRAVEFLAAMGARGGTEILAPLREALGTLSDAEENRDRVLVLVTDGQVGNEDQILRELGSSLSGVRVHTVGIDRAVNAGFLGRLAALGGGRCELVESEDRLDDAMDQIHRRIATPLVTGLRLAAEGLGVVAGSVSPSRLPDVFCDAPVRIMGRYSGSHSGAVTVTGQSAQGEPWSVEVPGVTSDNTALAAVWARARLRDLEDRYLIERENREHLERSIVDISLRYGVLCRFTAFLAVDTRVVTDGGEPHRVTQPVEMPSGWEPMLDAVPASYGGAPAAPGGMMRTAMTSFAPAPGAAAPVARGRAASAPAERDGAAFDMDFDMDYDVRTEAADERRLLADAAGGSALVRWQALADLANRLRQSTWFFQNAVTAAPEREPLVRLGEELAVCDGPLPSDPAVLERLWQRTVDVLDAVAAGAPDPDAPDPAQSGIAAPGEATDGGQRRTGFWKR